MECTPAGTGCSRLYLTGSQVLSASLLQHGLLSSQGHRSWQESAPVQASHGVTPSFRHSLLLRGLQVDLCSILNLHGLQGHSLSHSALAPPSALTLGYVGLFLSHILTPSSSSCCTPFWLGFLLLFDNIIHETPLPSLTAQPWLAVGLS